MSLGANNISGALLLGLLTACAGSSRPIERPFSTEWQNDGGASIAKVSRQLHGAPRVPNARLAVGVTAGGLSAVDLDGRSRWTYRGKVIAVPVIAGKLVLVSGPANLTALDASSGQRIWEVPSGGFEVRGAGDDGSVSAAVLSPRDSARTLFLAVDRSGSVRMKLESATQLGAPAVLGGMALVPWGHQYVSALDLRRGEEVARAVLRDNVFTTLNAGGEVYFGGHHITHFDEDMRGASAGAVKQTRLPERTLPGNPSWLSPTPLPVDGSSARTRIRLFASPSFSGGQIGFASQRYVASYFRVLLGLDTADGSLVWVRSMPADVVGGAAAQSGFAFCGASGKVWLVGESGGKAGELELGDRVTACAVDAGTEAISRGQPAGSLVEQISLALRELTPDMAAVQRFLLPEVGKLKEDLATQILIEQTHHPYAGPEVRTEARRLLALRRTGKEHMLAALRLHYDFLTDELTPPPVGPLADALSAIGESAAAPLLARHLNDPANSTDDVERAARALSTLASAGEYDALRTFFSLYRATADEPPLVNAVISVARALVRIGGSAGRDVVERAAFDALTHPDVKQALPGLLSKPSSPPNPKT